MKNLVTYLFYGLAVLLVLWVFLPIACHILNINLPFSENAIDIQLHDTYFVVSYWPLVGMCSMLLFLNALVYFLIQPLKEVPTGLVIIHFILLLMVFVYVLVSPFIRSIEPNYYSTTGTSAVSILLWITGLSFFIATILFLFNIFFLLFLSLRKTSSK